MSEVSRKASRQRRSGVHPSLTSEKQSCCAELHGSNGVPPDVEGSPQITAASWPETSRRADCKNEDLWSQSRISPRLARGEHGSSFGQFGVEMGYKSGRYPGEAFAMESIGARYDEVGKARWCRRPGATSGCSCVVVQMLRRSPDPIWRRGTSCAKPAAPLAACMGSTWAITNLDRAF
ncbi:hypothetical protein B0T21DRAFT_346489 [Apiosordaria backusii]|uniref:Uncharacterized protein n=1 Tax=Apiosordaria backusii TaxID=314023 RepID=A0AA40BRP1_9PEZI|nr:hypothetical protein B0T21DRAFT_346489 [Apiosordaria backusii]